MSSNGNYHSQQRRYFVTSDGGAGRLHGQTQQLAHDAANGLPQMQTSGAMSNDSLARLHHYNYDQPAAGQQQQARHFYGPIESVSTHRAANGNNLASGSAYHRLERPAAGLAAEQTQGVNFDDSNFESSRARASEHYSDRVHSHHHHRPNNNNNNHPQHQHHEHRKHDQMSCQTNQGQRHLSECHCSSDRSRPFEQRHECDRDQYANQLRRSQLQQRIGAQNHRVEAPPTSFHGAGPRQQMQADGHKSPAQVTMRHQDHKTTGQQQASGSSGAGQQQPAKELLHVNFNRSSQSTGAGGKETDDDESGESTRKKKYLTAKYGQQQMNLIKKRLKIEMWLHDQLQELAKESKAIEPDELDEIDIDLDQLLDMDDDSTRRRWLRTTLQPLSDLPNESLEKFIDQVLEQSKLL